MILADLIIYLVNNSLFLLTTVLTHYSDIFVRPKKVSLFWKMSLFWQMSLFWKMSLFWQMSLFWVSLFWVSTITVYRGRHQGLGPGPGLKIEKYGIGTQICGTRDSKAQIRWTVPGTKEFRDSVPGTENFPGHGPGPCRSLPVCTIRNDKIL